MTLDQVLDYPFTPFFPVIRVKVPSQAKGRIFAQPLVLKGDPKVTLNCTPAAAAAYRMDHAYETVVMKYPKYIQRELRGQ